MSRIERFRSLALHPIDCTELEGRQRLANDLVSQFVGGEMNLLTFRERLGQMQGLTKGIIICQPGPVYGFLRRIGLSGEMARKVADEERAHFWEARKAGLNPKFVFVVSEEVGDESIKRLSVFVSYEIPGKIDEKLLREVIIKISLAPVNPSLDDLAKLPMNLPAS